MAKYNEAQFNQQFSDAQMSIEKLQELRKMYSKLGGVGGADEIVKQIDNMIAQGQGMIEGAQTQNLWGTRYNMLSDPTSDLYKSFQSSLNKSLNDSTPTVDSLLGIARAMGGDFGGSTVIANKQREAAEGRNREVAGNATQGYFNQNQGLAQGALSGYGQEGQFGRSLMENARQFNENLQFQRDSQPTFFDNLLNIGSTVAGTYTGGLIGGAKKTTSRDANGYYF